MANNNISNHNRARPQSLMAALKQRRSGYEPSDTETEWQDMETPWNNNPIKKIEDSGFEIDRNVSPLKPSRRSAKFEGEVRSPSEPSAARLARRSHSKSPYKPRGNDNNGAIIGNGNGNSNSTVRSSVPVRSVSPFAPNPGSDFRNISPFSKSERRRAHVSPHKGVNVTDVNRKQKQGTRVIGREENDGFSHKNEISRASEKSSYSHRSVSAPRIKKGDRTPSPLARGMSLKEREAPSHTKAPSIGEINEMVAKAKAARMQANEVTNFESTDSISAGDIFFSRSYAPLTIQKITQPKMVTERETNVRHGSKGNGSFDHNGQGISTSTPMTQTTTASSSAMSRQSSGKISTGGSSKMSDASDRTMGSLRKFTASRQKSQKEAWFSCIKKGSCRTTKSPEKNRDFDESSFIEKAFVVESLRQFWADKYQPGSFNAFICHKSEAQVLNQLVASEVCPHIMLKGPPGSDKRALSMAFLCEIFGDAARHISHDLRYFHIQERRPMQVVVPVTSSAHHVELNVYSEPNARYAMMALVREINSKYAVTPEVSTVNFKADYKVMVLYEVCKAPENIQHLIKWIMDCYKDSCKLILCCEDDVDILEPVTNRCKVINVNAPLTHEIMEVLIHIARKENFDLSISFAERIATKSKQNLRRAIMSLEACKAHNYPFVEDQPIPVGWEEVLEEVAADILANPLPKRLFVTRGKIQKLLLDFVQPKLILQKLVEQFLKGVEASLKRELYYWHAYYEKRLPTGTSALLKLEEFVAKFMSIYRKSTSNNRQDS